MNAIPNRLCTNPAESSSHSMRKQQRIDGVDQVRDELQGFDEARNSQNESVAQRR